MTDQDAAADEQRSDEEPAAPVRSWYRFAPSETDGDRGMRALLGGKGANLAEMCRLGVPVPPGFTLPTTRCLAFFEAGHRLDDVTLAALEEGMAFIESVSDGARFGDHTRPLLVSVRSGARDSMPGMMDTVLNLGLNPDTVAGLAEWSGDRRFALDAYRRLIQMFGDVVRGIGRDALEEPLTRARGRLGVQYDHELPAKELEVVVRELLEVYERETGESFPDDPLEQLRQASAAVFVSWWGRRAQTYRALNGIPDSWGTAANVQAMVYGNLGEGSASGVAFSRNPATGERRPMGEWLPSAQGEDVVAGIRTPAPLSSYEVDDDDDIGSLEENMPEVYGELIAVMERLENHYLDLQDVEFTVQEGRLYLLQTRNGKRTAGAAVRAAVVMVREGLIDERTAVTRVAADAIDQLLHPQIDPDAPRELLARGRPASPGAASGYVVLDAEEAERLDITLDIIEAVSGDPGLAGWNGFGVVVQCYQKRAGPLLDWLADMARRHGRRLMLRLVKGGYWDTEIKRSQERGLEGYPVFTRKASTDVS
ncbi:MAG: proline dehydrogenase family protein, partial [Acidobacteria bacterium]|nr:proline dehydrogenase family protein [Acidobacteriota bacterium]